MHKILITVLASTFLLNSSIVATDSTSAMFPKSRHRAVLYSLVSTSVPMVVGGVMMNNDRSASLGTGIASLGLILGPGVGHVYAQNPRRFWSGAATRGIVLSSSIAVAAILIDDSVGDTWEEGLPKAMLAVGIVGAGVTVCTISAVRDISTADNSAEAYNSQHGLVTLSLSPAYIPSRKTPGIMLRLTF